MYFSYDARELAWNHGTRWSDEFQFGERAYFDLNSSPAALVVDHIRREEAGVYRCGWTSSLLLPGTLLSMSVSWVMNWLTLLIETR